MRCQSRWPPRTPDDVQASGMGDFRPATADSPGTDWRDLSYRGYTDHKQTVNFASNPARVIERARTDRVALMSAEAVPWRCDSSPMINSLHQHIACARRVRMRMRMRMRMLMLMLMRMRMRDRQPVTPAAAQNCTICTRSSRANHVPVHRAGTGFALCCRREVPSRKIVMLRGRGLLKQASDRRSFKRFALTPSRSGRRLPAHPGGGRVVQRKTWCCRRWCLSCARFLPCRGLWRCDSAKSLSYPLELS